MKDIWQKRLENSMIEHITAAHIVSLLICAVAFISFGPMKNLSMLGQVTGTLFILLLLVYWAAISYIGKSIVKENRLVDLAEIIYTLFTFILILAVVITTGGINSPIKVLLLVPVIILSVTHGRWGGVPAATVLGLYLLIPSLASGYYGNPNKIFEANLIFTGVALLVGWMIGGFTDMEMEARKHLFHLNEELEQKVADRTNELAAVSRELENEIAERRQVEYELKAQNRIYDAMHGVLEEASAVSAPRYEGISTLADLAFSLQSVGYENTVAARLVEVACEIAGAKQGCYYGYDENTGHLNLVYTVGLPDLASRSGEASMFVKGEERGFVGLVAQTKKPVYVPDVQADPRWIAVDFARHIRSCYLLPFYHGEKLFGVFVLLSEHVDGFSKEKRVLADTLASYISTAMENARLFTEVHRAYERLNLTQQQLFHSQKMEAVGQLAGGMAHDLNNQMTVIQACVDLYLKSVPESDPIHKAFIRIRRAAERSANLTRQLMLFARKHPQFREPLDLNSNIRELQEMFKRMIGEDITIKLDLSDDLWIVNADAGNIDQVITNLVLNARDAMPQGGTITIKTENVKFEESRCGAPQGSRPCCFVRLTVEDTGTGMDEQVLSHIFEPFFTTKDPDKGTGLGLSVAYGIIQDHEGWINVKSKVGQGTVFEIYLPAMSTGMRLAGIKDGRLSSNELYGTGEKILLVEDDYEVMLLTSRILSENGYTVVSCGKACEAFKIFEKEKDFCLVISDVILPDGSGIDIIRQMRASHPSLGGLLISGYSDERSNLRRIPRDEFRFLSKPYLAADLLRNIREILNQNQ